MTARPIKQIHTLVMAFISGHAPEHVLISSPPGMGRSSVLRSLARNFQDDADSRVLVVHGDLIASNGQLFGVLASQLSSSMTGLRHWQDAAASFFDGIRTRRDVRFVILVDDFDQLAYKRETLVKLLARELKATSNCLLVATCRNATVHRLTRASSALSSVLQVVPLTPMNDVDALELVRKRAPELASLTGRFVVSQAGGHPAAIVFMCRVFQIRGIRTSRHNVEILCLAAELAGAVYAEHWAELGPQQRAILWRLSKSPGAMSNTAELADALVLPPSHVSAQLVRLLDEGLIMRGSRGRYHVAPLLALWITERAVISVPPKREVERPALIGSHG